MGIILTMEKAAKEIDIRRNENKKEIGYDALWSLSTAKPGFGILQIRDNNAETYWQSDGSQPHHINIQFERKTWVSQVSIYTDHGIDESYTPREISIFVGTFQNCIQQY